MIDKRRVFAIIRLDDIKADGIELIDSISVTSVLPTQEEAEVETLRLNDLNKDTGSRYHWIQTRFYPEGKNPTE